MLEMVIEFVIEIGMEQTHFSVILFHYVDRLIVIDFADRAMLVLKNCD